MLLEVFALYQYVNVASVVCCAEAPFAFAVNAPSIFAGTTEVAPFDAVADAKNFPLFTVAVALNPLILIVRISVQTFSVYPSITAGATSPTETKTFPTILIVGLGLLHVEPSFAFAFIAQEFVAVPP